MRLRYLAVITTLGALVIILASALVWLLLQPPTPALTGPAPAPPSSPPAGGYNPDATDADDENRSGPPETQEALWGPVVDSFARNFTNTRGGAEKWRQRLIGDPAHPQVTTDVAEQLATVDVRNVPDGHYASRELVKDGPYEIGVKVTYREGWAQVLYLTTDGSSWQIYAYDKWEA